MSQTSYAFNLAAALAGMKADAAFDYVESHPAQAQIDFGLAVVHHAAGDDRVRIPGAADVSADLRGIALHTHKEKSTDGYLATETVNVLRQGMVWVPVMDTVVDGDPVYAINVAANFGKFRNDNTNAILLPGAVFRSSAVSGELAKVEINLPA